MTHLTAHYPSIVDPWFRVFWKSLVITMSTLTAGAVVIFLAYEEANKPSDDGWNGFAAVIFSWLLVPPFVFLLSLLVLSSSLRGMPDRAQILWAYAGGLFLASVLAVKLIPSPIIFPLLIPIPAISAALVTQTFRRKFLALCLILDVVFILSFSALITMNNSRSLAQAERDAIRTAQEAGMPFLALPEGVESPIAAWKFKGYEHPEPGSQSWGISWQGSAPSSYYWLGVPQTPSSCPQPPQEQDLAEEEAAEHETLLCPPVGESKWGPVYLNAYSGDWITYIGGFQVELHASESGSGGATISNSQALEVFNALEEVMYPEWDKRLKDNAASRVAAKNG